MAQYCINKRTQNNFKRKRFLKAVSSNMGNVNRVLFNTSNKSDDLSLLLIT